MSIAHYNPWTSFGQLHREINRLFDGHLDDPSRSAVADWAPPVDIFEFGDRFELQAELPGVEPDSVEITLDNGVLAIGGQRAAVAEDDSVQRSRIERVPGRFFRRFTLPETADADKVEANSRNGVLTVRIAKREQAQPRQIKVAA